MVRWWGLRLEARGGLEDLRSRVVAHGRVPSLMGLIVPDEGQLQG